MYQQASSDPSVLFSEKMILVTHDLENHCV